MTAHEALIARYQQEVVKPQDVERPSDNNLTADIVNLLERKSSVLIAHYYTSPDLQRVAEISGGFVGDSLEMARFGRDHAAQNVIVAGVRFMGETAKILSPHKRIYMPTLEATCSLAIGCPADAFEAFCDAHPERTSVVYANTSAEVKARADWVVTSSIAVPLIAHLHAEGKPLIWAPDRYLGDYVQKQTGADMLLWQGSCIVHETFKAEALQTLKALHPEAAILAHPEAPYPVIEMADVVGSTSQLIEACRTLPHPTCIVATERGIFYKMQQAAPHKILIQAPSGGNGATCKSCIHCPWMAMNNLENLRNVLLNDDNEITLSTEVCEKALKPLNRMLAFATAYKTNGRDTL